MTNLYDARVMKKTGQDLLNIAGLPKSGKQ